MKNEESKAMKEIREIRARLSEKMKNMTPEEQVEFTRKGSEELEKEFGITFMRRKKVPAGKR